MLRALGAALLKGVHVPVVTGEARAVVEELEVRSETATKLDGVASVVGVEELSIRGDDLIAECASRSN